MLLVSVEYDQQLMQGPPFSMKKEETERLLKPHGTLKLLETRDSMEDRLRQRGLNSMLEYIFLFGNHLPS